MNARGHALAGSDESAVRNYFVICLGALALLFLVLLRRGLMHWSSVPVTIGLLGAWQRWRLAPFMMLVALVILIVWLEPWGDGWRRAYRQPRTFQLQDWILCIAVLGYFAAHYRLQALTHAIFPSEARPEPPLAPESGDSAAASAHNAAPANSGEIGMLLLVLPLCGLLAQVFWRLLPRDGMQMPGRVWQGIVAGWCLMVIVFIGHAVLRYLGWKQQSPREARLVVQDALWQETRREQRRIQYWLAWAALRRKRRKERS